MIKSLPLKPPASSPFDPKISIYLNGFLDNPQSKMELFSWMREGNTEEPLLLPNFIDLSILTHADLSVGRLWKSPVVPHSFLPSVSCIQPKT